MSDTSDLASDVASDVVDEVDVGSVVTGDDVTEDMDGESLGRSVGETVGESLGRLVGRNLVNWLASKLSFGGDDEDGEPSVFSRVGGALTVAVGRTLKKPEFKEPIGDAARNLVDRIEERQADAAETAEDAGEGAKDAAEDAAETAEDAGEGAKDAAEDAGGAATEKASAAAEKLESGQMDELRKETYRELLEMMEYSKLQSIAKESDVRANLPQDEMVDAIVEQFDADESDESDESDDSDEE